MLKKLIICFAMAVIFVMSANARIITIQGKVTIMGKGVPAVDVEIYDQKIDEKYDPREFGIERIGITDVDGRYIVKAESTGKLYFRNIDGMVYSDDINGRNEINMQVQPSSMHDLDEVSVYDNASPIPIDKGSQRIRGDHLIITNSVRITKTFKKPEWSDNPETRKGQKQRFRKEIKESKNHFRSERREIYQPVVLNKTRKQITYISPVVVDSDGYAITQERMDDWDTSIDPLTHYRHIVPFKDTVVTVVDSFKLENKDDYMVLIAIRSIEDYNRITLQDTNIIVEGVYNPLKFLSYNIPALEMTDEEITKAAPGEERDLRSTEGKMNLTFSVGKSHLDPSVEENAVELDKFDKDLQELLADNDVTLKSIKVYGFSSPEGGYESNMKLANDRMKTIMSMIVDKIPRDRMRGVERSAEAEVAPWEEVVNMLRTDSLFEEADQIQEILDRNLNMDVRFRAISKLPFYRPLLTDTYLPRLRRVTYTITAEKFRELTDEEIEQEYLRDPSSLHKYHLFRYYNSKAGEEREAVLRKAIELFPYTKFDNHFVVAATELSIDMLNKGENPFEMLSPYFGENRKNKALDELIPFAMRYNYAIGALMNSNFEIANSILSRMQHDDRAKKAIAFYKVKNEDFSDDVIEEICKDNQLNRVVIELARDHNARAWRVAQQIEPTTGVEYYVKAIAAYRNRAIDGDLEYAAEDFLVEAFKLDPSLREKAEGDADVRDLLHSVDYILQQQAEEEAREAEIEEAKEAAKELQKESTETTEPSE